jgi:hypothetical protein
MKHKAKHDFMCGIAALYLGLLLACALVGAVFALVQWLAGLF